ncbi:hypothetical protein [Streptomyces sp. DW26H14]|uniref:hypothetical protein n=1 Tax=Streptomyces sp. DW26H14 TaxID=3435395 RepID=UPI00403DAAD3
MNRARWARAPWYAALAIVSAAALATTGWSLYAVGRHYSAPELIAGAAVAVFDGAAYACLYLASEASRAGRSAVGARLATLAMVGTSVYLNVFHADLIHGGPAAALLFAVPSLALLAVSELAWAGPRAAARAERGEQPYRLPGFGGWAWLLAPRRAGSAVRSRAIDHIENGPRPGASRAPAESAKHTASEVLRRRFAEMDPAEVIRIAHDAHPDAAPAELASLLITYGVIVDAVQVALVLGGVRPAVTVERADTGDAPADAGDAPQVGELPPPTKTQAIIEAAAVLGPAARPADIVDRVQRINRLTVDNNYVRTVLSREGKRTRGDRQGGGPMEGGYA